VLSSNISDYVLIKKKDNTYGR